MPLNPAVLKDALEKIMKGEPSFPADAQEAGNRWGDALVDYWKTAASCGSAGAPSPGAEGKRAAVRSALASGFAGGNPGATANGFVQAFTAYWAVLPFPGPTPGVAAPPLSLPALPGSLSAFWASAAGDQNMTHAQAAQAHADFFHATTLTAVITHSPPSACTGPPV